MMGARTVKKVKRKLKTESVNYNVPTQNRFMNLTNKTSEVSKPQPEKPKLPAAITITDDCAKADTVLAEIPCKFRRKIIGVGVKIFTDRAEDKAAIMAKLTEGNVGFFTHPDTAEKVFKVVIKGLPDLDTKTVEEALRSDHNLTPIKIIKMGNGDNKLYLVHFNKAEVTLPNIRKITVVYQHIITWQQYRPKKSGPTQCYKCLMYGHGAASCHRSKKCMLCGQPHDASECPLGQRSNETNVNIFKCYNCGHHGMPCDHKATDPNCPFRARYVAIRQNLNNKNKPQTRRPHQQQKQQPQRQNEQRNVSTAPTPRPMSMSYVNALKHNLQPHSRTSTNSHTHSTTPDNDTEHSSDTLWSFSEVADILMHNINELSKCKTKLDQMKVITNMLKNAFN